MAKSPLPGKVKTRLAEDLVGHDAGLAEEKAALLAQAFLLDTLELVEGSELPAYLACDAGYLAGLEHLENRGWELLPQGEGDLGERMERVMSQVFQRGHAPVLVLGTDCPHLPPQRLYQALEALRLFPVCLGPSYDGGYYLLGLQRPCPVLFQGIVWSTPRVFRQTLERARGAGLEVGMLQQEFDVDTVQDLLRLIDRLAGSPPAVARWTRRALQQMEPYLKKL